MSQGSLTTHPSNRTNQTDPDSPEALAVLAAMRRARTDIAEDIRTMLYSAAQNQRSAMTRKDAAEWLRMMTSEVALETGGAYSEEDKLDYIKGGVNYARIFVKKAEKLGAEFLEKIKTAEEKKWISTASAEKWRNRLKDHSGSWPETEDFLSKFDETYLSNWEKVDTDIKAVEKFKEDWKIGKETIPELAFLDESDFLDKNYHERRNTVSLALAAIEAWLKGREALKSEAEKELKTAAAEKIISQYKIGPWVEHIVSGKRTLKELLSYIKDWRSIKQEYDKVEAKLDATPREPHGFKRIEPDKFLLLTYEQRVSYVQEANWRLNHHLNFPEDTPIEDLKGKIRHALDTQDWEDAELFLKKAWDIATKPSDINELHSLERNLHYFRTTKGVKGATSENSGEEIKGAMAEIESALSQLPGPMRRVYEKALARGTSCLRCVGKTVYNVKWCKDRNYLNEEIIQNARSRADSETRDRLRASGKGHGNGLENNRVDGFHQPAIRDNGTGPQNLFIGNDGADAFIEKADQNKDVYSFWYWTNAIFDGVSMEQYEMVATVLNPIFKRNSQILQKYGMVYSASGRPVSVN